MHATCQNVKDDEISTKEHKKQELFNSSLCNHQKNFSNCEEFIY